MRSGELLHGDHNIIPAIAGNAIWEKWNIGLPLPSFTYDLNTQRGEFLWQLPESLAVKMKSVRGKNKEFSLLHEFTNDTGLIATYKYVSKTNRITLRFWLVSPSVKEILYKHKRLTNE